MTIKVFKVPDAFKHCSGWVGHLCEQLLPWLLDETNTFESDTSDEDVENFINWLSRGIPFPPQKKRTLLCDNCYSACDSGAIIEEVRFRPFVVTPASSQEARPTQLSLPL
jgi:hypothetical protein